MKKHLLYFSMSFVAASFVVAQPTLTATGINPQPGETMTLHATNYVSPGNPGANQTWNLAFNAVAGAASNWVSPSSTPNGSSFPTASVASGTSPDYGYFNCNSTAYQTVGAVGQSGQVIMPYSNPEDLFHFPFNINNTYSDTWASSFTSGGFPMVRTGTTTVTFDGYGTVTTPGGTFSNVARIHWVQTYQDSFQFGVYNYSNDQYSWWVNGYHNYVASVGTLTMMGNPTQFGYYASNVTVGMNDVYASQVLNVFPVPASDKLSLSVNNANDISEVKIYNVAGAEVKIIEGGSSVFINDNAEISVADLPQGIYFVQIRKGDALTSKKIVISR